MFLPWPSMVAAIKSYRYLPPTRSAALRKMDALSAHGSSSHAVLAASEDAIALSIVSGVAEWYEQRCLAWSNGKICLTRSLERICERGHGTSVRICDDERGILTSLPSTTQGTSNGICDCIFLRAASRPVRSAEPGA